MGPSPSPIEDSWGALPAVWQVCIEQAVESFSARGLPVGAAVTNVNGLLATGRNRVYDPAGGADPLQRNALAHAEMNALAKIGTDIDLAVCDLWTTHSPCSMCRAAAQFVGVRAVHHLALDPSDDAADRGDADRPTEWKVWAVAVNVLFLHNVAWVAGADNSILLTNEQREPATTSLAIRLVSERTLIDRLPEHDPVELLGPIWDDILEAASHQA